METSKPQFAALREITTVTGIDAPVRVTGADPVFPTPFLVGMAGAAALGASVSGHSALCTSRGQDISISVRDAAAALRCATYLEIDGAKPESLRDP